MIWGVLHDVSYFLGDDRMLLAELKVLDGARQPSEEETAKQMEIAGEGSPQLKDERKWLRD